MSRVVAVAILIVLMLPVAACASKMATTTREMAKPADLSVTPASGNSGSETWQKEWEDVKVAARKEGKVTISSGVAAVMRRELERPFRDKFGVNLEFVLGLPSEVIPRIITERRAGIYTVDIIMTGPPNLVNSLKPNGVLASLDGVVFLLEALDPKAWFLGDLPWVDKDHQMLALLARPSAHLLINTNLVRREEVRSYRDLLDPRWKGRIIFNDPTKAGQGNAWFSSMAERLMSLEYLREFVRQEPMITRDDRLMVEWITQGKYPMAVGAREELVSQFKDAGAPIELIIPVEGTHVSAGGACMGLLKNAPHPSSAKLFINWILSKEGATLFSRANGAQSARVDVPTDFLDPLLVRQPGAKYYNTSTEENGIIQVKNQELAKQIFAPLLK